MPFPGTLNDITVPLQLIISIFCRNLFNRFWRLLFKEVGVRNINWVIGFTSEKEVCDHWTFSFNLYGSPTFHRIPSRAQYVVNFLSNLDLIKDSSRIHSRSNIYGISPNVVLRLPGTNHSSYNWSYIDTWKLKSYILKKRFMKLILCYTNSCSYLSSS